MFFFGGGGRERESLNNLLTKQIPDLEPHSVICFSQICVEEHLIVLFSVLLKSLVQMALAALAGLVMVTRLRDNRHHASDVVSGALLGILVAVYVVRFFLISSEKILC